MRFLPIIWSERAAGGGTVIPSASALSTARSISGAMYRSMLAGPHAASCRSEATAPGSVMKLERCPASYRRAPPVKSYL